MKHVPIIFVAAITLAPVSANACLNDREIVAIESQFRSQYESPANPGSAIAGTSAATGQGETRFSPVGVTLSGVGLMLMFGAIQIGKWRFGRGEKSA